MLTLACGMNPDIAIWYLSMPLAITMIYWWGPRVLIGFYLAALGNALFLELEPAQSWALFGLPEVAGVFLSWLLFIRVFRGKCWMPDTRNTTAWFVLGIAIPLIIALLSAVFRQPSLQSLFTKEFRWIIWTEWVSDVFWTLVICSPLLIFLTPFLENRGWTRTSGAARPEWIPSGRTHNIVPLELAAIFIGISILGTTASFERHWLLFGAFSIWSALRYGIAMAITANSVIILLTLVIPISFSNGPDAVRSFRWGLLSVDPGMALLYIICLITGRSYSDIMAEMKERVLAETELRKEKAFTDAALDAQNDVFLVFEPITGKPIRWNKAFIEMSGVSDEDIAHTHIPDDWIEPDKIEEVAAQIKALRTLKQGTVELTFLSRNGERIPTEYAASLMTTDAIQSDYVIAIGRNISERKKIEMERKELESQLRQALKMEAVGTLAAGIANDFNNILSTIIGFSELIYDDVKDTPHLKSHMEHVLSAGERAKILVRQILAFSRQSEGSHTTFYPSSTLRETTKLLRSSTPTNIVVRKEIDQHAGAIHADPTQFHQVVMNLYSNACHAMENEGGTLTIALRRTFLTRAELKNEPEISEGEFIQFTVADTGEGIAPNIQDKIFEPYFTTKSIGRGTGLGLAIVHGIVKNSGGFIRLESALGEGSAFHIYFPVSEDEEPIRPSSAEPLAVGTEHILYVDDEEDILAVSERILGRAGYRVTAKTSSLEALETFSRNPEEFDLVITDQSMPDMSGLELATRINQIRPSIPILLYTGYTSDVNKSNMADFGIHKVLIKPLRMNILGAAVREVIDQNARRHSSDNLK